MRRGFKWDKKYLYWGVTAFCVVAASVAFFMVLNRFSQVKETVSKLFSILSPFIVGAAIAYLLCPLMLRVERGIFGVGKFSKKKNRYLKSTGLTRGLSVAISMLVFFALLTALVYIIIPRTYSSIETIVVNSGTYVDSLNKWTEKMLSDYPQIEEYFTGFAGNFSDTVINWLTSKLLPGMGNWVASLTTTVFSVVYNLIVGVVASCYLLSRVESVGARSRRLLYSIFTVEAGDRICKALRFSDRTVKGFLGGKVLDSAIVAVLCYVVFSIVHMPYTLLISVIIGVTNIIPVFGPFIGAIPSGIFVFMVSPRMCLVFIIIILIVQQIDGHILGPKILGSTVGISGFWVMFSIIVGSGYFGFWGMLLGVPVFVILYAGYNILVERKLKRSGLPTNPAAYRDMDHIDPVTYEVVKKTPKDTPEESPEEPAQR